MTLCWSSKYQAWFIKVLHFVFFSPSLFFSSRRSFPFSTCCVTASVFATRLPAIFTSLFLKSSLAQCSPQRLTEDTPAITDSASSSSSVALIFSSLRAPLTRRPGATWCKLCASCQLNVRTNNIYIYIKILEYYRHCFFGFLLIFHRWEFTLYQFDLLPQ